MKSNLLFLATIFATAMVATIATLADEKSTVQQEPSQAVRLPVEGAFPSLAGANGWLNAPPLTPESLHGKVVLVGRTQRATRTRRLVPLPDRAGVGAPCVRHAGHSRHAWPSSGRAGNGAGTMLTDIATTVHHPSACPGRRVGPCSGPTLGRRGWYHSVPLSRSWRKNSSSSCIICSELKSSPCRGCGASSPVVS
jgi:hypothetical protein